jgi:hypothetical protein
MALVFCNVVAQLLEAFVPSSVQWMNGIVCASGYHLAPHSSSYSYGTHSGININFQCVNGASRYDTSIWPIHAILILSMALVLCGVAAVGVLMWRQMRKP